MNEPARIFGVFYEPGKVFADVAERPRWLVPVVISILFALAFSYAISSHIGWEQTIRQTLANNPRTADACRDLGVVLNGPLQSAPCGQDS